MEREAVHSITDLAFEQAAKVICNLKCGICPIREENFSDCPFVCNEEIRPWQCWVIHLREVACRTQSGID